MNQELLETIRSSVDSGRQSFCRFITANDTGRTGAHQSGFYMPKSSVPMLFDEPGRKGENKDRLVTIKWQDDFETNSRLIYYGVGSRNEYRLTRFGRDFPFLTDEFTGALFILIQSSDDGYNAFVLNHDDDIEAFLEHYNLAASNLNRIFTSQNCHKDILGRYVENLDHFPTTSNMGLLSWEIYNKIFVGSDPDKKILDLISIEYDLFKELEEKIYLRKIQKGFESIDELVVFSNEILNRRKSRAGKSLEHHLSGIFRENSLAFEEQVVTEDNKRPDFIFPGGKEYHDLMFPSDRLVCLAAKTTCKDRWRQILNEADRVETKYLFTLQQGISLNQLKEMAHERVRLVVPERNLSTFSIEYRSEIMSLKNFINHVRLSQN